MKTRTNFWNEVVRTFSNLKFILKIMLQSAPLFMLLTILFSLFSGLGDVAQSFFIGKVVDGITDGAQFERIVSYACIIIFFQLLAKLQSRTLFAMNRVVTQEISIKMESDILDLAENIPLKKMDEPGFLNRMEQVRNLVKKAPNSVFMILFGAVGLLAGTIGYVTILSRVSVVYVLILVVCSALIFTANYQYEENVMSSLFAMSPERRKMEYFSGLLTKRDTFEEIRSYNASGYLRREYKKNAKRQMDVYHGIFRKYTGFYGAAALVAYCGCGLVYVLIIRKAFLGQISLGDMTMFLTACLGFQAVLTELTDGLCSLPSQLNAMQNYRDFWESFQGKKPKETAFGVEKMQEKGAKENLLVQVDGVTFAYPGSDKIILNQVSFDIKRGECVALVGPNGAGKTTLVRLLSGFYGDYRGNVIVNGVENRSLLESGNNASVSIMFQNYMKPSMTVGEAIILNSLTEEEQAAAYNALEKSTYPLGELPRGLNTELTREFAKDGVIPSGGQWQKLALARMFYREAPLYVLDEPSASLDPQAEDEIFRLLQEMKGEHAILFITHRLASVSIADRVIYLSADGVAVQGTHEELMKSCEGYREIYRLQASKYM